ncbi:MAG: DUF3276 family protein [Bacteroidales bacterium]|nr:DUF3276 family protein [Bacteroidales bacterium]MBR5532474.1 DUF3276 family protein [Bacteroidales bacterium]
MDTKIESENRPLEKDMMFSKVIKAGSRVYYIDVKRSKKEDLYITITESKRVSAKDEEVPRFEKHKLFLYKEDFEKFKEALNEAIDYTNKD